MAYLEVISPLLWFQDGLNMSLPLSVVPEKNPLPRVDGNTFCFRGRDISIKLHTGVAMILSGGPKFDDLFQSSPSKETLKLPK